MDMLQWWIQNVENRISAGLIYAFILILFGTERRKHFLVRVLISILLLCGVSWVIRFWISGFPRASEAEAYGYSVHMVAMALAFYAAFRLVYRCSGKEALFRSTVGFILYRVAWCSVKAVIQFRIWNGMTFMWDGSPLSPLFSTLFSYSIYFGTVLVCWIFFRKYVRGETSFPFPPLIMLTTATLSGHVILDLSMRLFGGGDGTYFPFYLTSVFFCASSYALMLYLHRLEQLREDYDHMQNFLKSKQQYYEISKEGIRSLQTKCHDLKHQIALIRSTEGKLEFDRLVEGLETSINEYNTVIHTGNDAIDVVLTEKNIIFITNRIKFTYIVDGSLFSFMPDLDIYTLFGNALDNAIEGAMKIENPEERMVSLRAGQHGDYVTIHIENSFDGEIRYSNGLPVTTKPDDGLHGFGVHSLMDVAEKYDGSLRFDQNGSFFVLNMMLKALPEKAA
ncbi:MAG: sensor histidine kinase [Lachnospiraceae bacterium]|nr:sensor histidine kinase [Lachnospiraceae bacterium]